MTEKPRNLTARQQRNARNATDSPPANRDNNALVRGASRAVDAASKQATRATRDVGNAIGNAARAAGLTQTREQAQRSRTAPPLGAPSRARPTPSATPPRAPLPRGSLRGKQKP